MLILIFLIIGLGIAASLPLYMIVNIFCWIFNISFHLTLLKAFALCVILAVVYVCLEHTKFKVTITKNKEDD